MNGRHAAAAEFLGTFFLVFAGCGAMVVDDLYGGRLGHVGVSLVFGLVVMAMIYAVGNVSGAHLNPAVTLGFWFAGRLPGRRVAPYVVAQCAAAVAAAAVLRALFPLHATLGGTWPAGDPVQSLVLEIILTFLLMSVVFQVSTGHMEKGIMAGVAVGGTVALASLMGGPVSGASLNPARSLGPALVAGKLGLQWVYVVGPVAGALTARSVCRLVQGDDCCAADGEGR
jgi:aquaporin Z